MSCNCSNEIKIDMVVRSPELTPTYANPTDGFMDIRVDLGENRKSYSVLAVPQGHTIMVPTGIQVSLPEDYVMLMVPRSSTGTKLKCMFANTMGVIDAGYRDEIKMAVYNYGDKPVMLEHGQRIGQFMVIKRPKIHLNLVEDNEDFRQGDRKGGFGSSGV